MYASDVAVTVRLPAETVRRLEILSEQTQRSRSYYVREAVNAHLDHLEWAYLIQAEAAAARAGTLNTVSFEDALTELGLTRADLDADETNEEDPPDGGQLRACANA